MAKVTEPWNMLQQKLFCSINSRLMHDDNDYEDKASDYKKTGNVRVT